MTNKKDSLGDRMKKFYEEIPSNKLMRRCPVIIRIDGKAFHTLTRGFQKPFDDVLIKTMQETTKYLCENIQGVVAGYTQSDEITLVLVDYQTHTTSAWFDYEVQKMCSISASMATMAFNRIFTKYVNAFDMVVNYDKSEDTESNRLLLKSYKKALSQGAMFDARCFNIPKEEVTNCVYWRQQDASRNSVQMLGRAYFSHKELDHKTSSNIQDMLMSVYNVNWNDLVTYKKRGSAVIKVSNDKNRPHWIIDKDMPILTGENRKYINDLVYVGE